MSPHPSVREPRALRAGAGRRFAPLFLVAAVLGAYAAIGPKWPRDHEVVLDFGAAAPEITDVEFTWSDPRAPLEDAALSTRWHFGNGSAPGRLHAHVRLADGEWDVEVVVTRAGRADTTRWSRRVNLEGTPWWKRDNLGDSSLVLPVREALR